MQLGIGADVISPGLAHDGRDEIELRAEHYSNGGIAHPNPGENWFQLRYMHWF